MTVASFDLDTDKLVSIPVHLPYSQFALTNLCAPMILHYFFVCSSAMKISVKSFVRVTHHRKANPKTYVTLWTYSRGVEIECYAFWCLIMLCTGTCLELWYHPLGHRFPNVTYISDCHIYLRFVTSLHICKRDFLYLVTFFILSDSTGKYNIPHLDKLLGFLTVCEKMYYSDYIPMVQSWVM